jgi:hypothetical protein
MSVLTAKCKVIAIAGMHIVIGETAVLRQSAGVRQAYLAAPTAIAQTGAGLPIPWQGQC